VVGVAVTGGGDWTVVPEEGPVGVAVSVVLSSQPVKRAAARRRVSVRVRMRLLSIRAYMWKVQSPFRIFEPL
jgi:hypothetical protein